MPRAVITIDMDRLLPEDSGALVVQKPSDYAEACLSLRRALQDGSTLRIAVRHRTAGAWLSDLAAAYGEDEITVRRYTPRNALGDRWRIEIPAAITDPEIVRARLLDERITVREGQSFGDAILEHFYSGNFLYRTFPVARLAALVNDYDPERWKEASRRPLVALTLADKLNRWEQAARADAQVALIQRLRQDPESLRRDLAYYRLLAGYPAQLGEKLLGHSWEVFRKARVDVDGLQVASVDASPIVPQIEYYLSDVVPRLASSDDFLALLEQMSGHLPEEFAAVEKALQSHPEWVTRQLILRVEQRFQSLHAGLNSRIAALRRLVKPAFPEEPSSTWSAPEWLSWAADSYMPYYSWLESRKQQDDTVAEYATRFADWYYARFCSLKASEPQNFAFSALYLDRDQIKAEGTVALVILLDNFNYGHFGDLCRVFRERGMFLESSRPVLSLIPTATEVGKAALIASRGDQVDLPNAQYASLVQIEWQPLLPKKTAAYLPNVGELQQLSTLDNGLYFLNFLPVDQALHQDARETGRPHDEVIRDYLNTLAAAVAEFASRFQLGDRLQVYVLSDHGSTRIARGTVNVLDKSYYKALADEKHHRYISVSDQQLQKLPPVAEAQCYVIDRQKFKTNQNYLAARQYFRFADTTDDFYVHGGLTPEEVVVPYARFTMTAVTPEQPTVDLPTTEFRYAVESRVSVEIGNPNGFALESVSVRLVDAEADEALVDILPGKQKRTVELITRFRKAPGAGATRPLTLRIRYSYQGAQYSPPDVTFQITMKTMMEVTSDDFEF